MSEGPESGFYILDDQHQVVEVDFDTWMFWFQALRESGQHHVAATQIKGGPWVSTIFVGIGGGLGPGRDLLFETMVFTSSDICSAPSPLAIHRASTWDEALTGHEEMVERFGHGIGEQMRSSK